MAERGADLGQVLFEDKQGTVGCLGMILGVGALLLVAGALVLAGIVDIDADLNVPVGAGLVVVGLLLAAWGGRGLMRGTRTIAYHERGATVAAKGNATTFTYDEVRDLAYGVMPGEKPVRNLSFRAPGSEAVIEVSNFDPDGSSAPTAAHVEGLRDRMVAAVAKRMRNQLAAGETVVWTEQLRLSRKAVEAAGKAIPWQQVDRCEVDDDAGAFRLFAKGGGEPVATGKMTDAGFLPGWKLFEAVRPKA